MTTLRNRGISATTVLGFVFALVCLGMAGVIAAAFVPEQRATQVYAFITATIAPTVVALLALLRADHNAHAIARTADKVDAASAYINGHLERHDQLASDVLSVAENIATLAGPNLTTETVREAMPHTRTHQREDGGDHHG